MITALPEKDIPCEYKISLWGEAANGSYMGVMVQ